MSSTRHKPSHILTTMPTPSRPSLDGSIRSRSTRPPPVRLESFPSPPSFIPASPSTSFPNPPLCGPPSSPLPPVPGPSPISEEDTLLLLSSTRHRRLSKMSVNSVASSRRDSTATIGSISSVYSNGVPSLSPSVSGSSSSSTRARTESNASSNASLSAPPFSRVSPTPIKEEEDDFPISVADDSLANIDMRDLPPDLEYFPTTKGRASPDIQSIISSTPRPRKRSSSILSIGSNRSRPSPRSSIVSNSKTLTRGPSLRKVIDDDFSDVDELERQLEGNGSESDSSLDLHTPFAHVMLRDGLISPRSKIINQLPPNGQRPGSVLSTNSTRTKSGMYKDDRDTVKRRHRHRDGKLLRGGIGLTTGLGWSDSEDEDSPSPLTRRLSSLAMSRKSSSTSLRSNLSSLSRTPSMASDFRSNAAFSTKTPASPRLPAMPEAREDASTPPPLPPKDFMPRKSLPTPLSKLPPSPSYGTGPRPLKLTQTPSMLRSSSLGNRPSEPKPPPPTPTLSRTRTHSQPTSNSTPPSAFKQSSSASLGSIPSLNRQPSLPRSTSSLSSQPSLPRTPSVLAHDNSQSTPAPILVRQRSRIGTGMMYKRSPGSTSASGQQSLLNPSSRSRMPTPLSSSTGPPPSPSYPPGIGVAI